MKVFFSLFLIMASAVFALPIFEDVPYFRIEGKESQLVRPEGIALSPDGSFFAVANSNSSSITFFSLDGSNVPFFVLQGKETKLNYPHDVSFSPDGEFLAAANRKGNSVTIYRREGEGYASKPVATLQSSSFKGIGAVAYSPTENLLAVASTYSDQIFLYSYEGAKYQRKKILKAKESRIADGLAFSPDGHFLAMTSHGNHSVQIFEREFSSKPCFNLVGKETLMKFPHSLAFHPFEEKLIVSCAGGQYGVHIFEKEGNAFVLSPIQSIDVFDLATHCNLEKKFPEECGAKGVAITSDGKILIVCLPNMLGEDSLLFFRSR